MPSDTAPALTPLAVDAAKAAAMLGIGKRTFLRNVSRGLIPEGFRLGGRRLWRVADLRELVENGFRLPTQR